MDHFKLWLIQQGESTHRPSGGFRNYSRHTHHTTLDCDSVEQLGMKSNTRESCNPGTHRHKAAETVPTK